MIRPRNLKSETLHVISGKKRATKVSRRTAEGAEETAERIGLPFSVFFRLICRICERTQTPKVLAEAAENADEVAEKVT